MRWGTAAAGIRAGVPTIPVPHFADQPYWGRWLFELGVATRPIQQEELTVERLTEAINTATGDAEIRKAANALGERIRAEDGVGRAVNIIDDHLKRGGR